ncbi:Uncharacterised protein [Halioglobus japonicus]|nr:Uncharacterised protein [Halioglobus japonicus]
MTRTRRRQWIQLALMCALVVSAPSGAQSPETNRKLQLLTDQRLMLTAELDQFQETLKMVHPEETPPEQSPNSAVRTLAIGAVDIKERLIEVTEQEIDLLQQQIRAAKTKIRATQELSAANKVDDSTSTHNGAAAPAAPVAETAESQPAVVYEDEYTLTQEAENVERLHKLLQNYYVELEESARILPTTEEIAERELARRDAQTLEKIPFSVDKVRLSGSEASTALAEISQRLVDPRIPESRRDIAPICNIKTRLLDTLVSVENRSLKPVGKNHFIGRVKLQPGETTISILSDHWDVQLPEHAGVQDFIITLYRPVDGTPELHVFAVGALLAESKPHIPAWLPEELDLKMQAG